MPEDQVILSLTPKQREAMRSGRYRGPVTASLCEKGLLTRRSYDWHRYFIYEPTLLGALVHHRLSASAA